MRGIFVGLTTLDLVQRVPRPPGVDEKVVALCSDLAAGGPAATAAVTFAALGGRATLLTAIGPGPVGEWAAGELGRRGVAVVDCWAGGADVAVSAISVLDRTGQRCVVSRNAEDVTARPPDDLAGTLGEADVLLADGHHPALAVAAARAANAAGVPVVLDCGSAKPVYAELMPLTDAAVCSAAFTVTGAGGGFEVVSSALLAAGARVVAVSDGARPVRWRARSGGALEEGEVAVPEVPVRDTLGAGDVLHGAFAVAVAHGVRDPGAALSFAVSVASLRVQHAGPRAWLDDPALSAAAERLRAG